MQILIATRNPHKLAEITAILDWPFLEVVDTGAFPGLPEIEEDGATFDANAVKKAASLARLTGLWSLADDSGLEVAALGGAPGVRSARYAGEPVDCAANNAKLLRALSGVADRRACFRCTIALSDPRGHARTVTGSCGGVITGEPRGRGGFGYDPLFLPEGRTQTFAEMEPVLKNRISHRAAALREARRIFQPLLASASGLPQAASNPCL